jgi:hypothetical protein
MHGDFGSGFSQRKRDSGAKSARRSGDERGFTAEVESIENQGAVLSDC